MRYMVYSEEGKSDPQKENPLDNPKIQALIKMLEDDLPAQAKLQEEISEDQAGRDGGKRYFDILKTISGKFATIETTDFGGLYKWFASNEEVISSPEIEKLKKISGGVYLGVGYGGQNFSKLAKGTFDYAVIIDINPLVAEMFMPLIAALISKARNRAEYLGLLCSVEFTEERPFLKPPSKQLGRRLRDGWLGPVTWVLPAAPGVPGWLTGGRDTLAVRVTAHPLAAALCRAFGRALVSTSANRSGAPPARSTLAVRRLFGDAVDLILHGPLGGLRGPTLIRDGTTGGVLRR